MKLIYITAKKYPSAKADPFYVQSMARAFAGLLGDDFTFLVRGEVPQELRGFGAQAVRIPDRLRTACYFFWLPAATVARGWSNEKTVFLSYDPNLLSILIFWRSVLGFTYRVASDWHQLFDDWRDNYVARHSDYLTTTSERLKQLLVTRCAADPERILVAYGGVDPRPFYEKSKISKADLRKSLGLPQDKFLAGYAGYFTSIGQKKGLDTMIEALPLLPADIAMVFVGGRKDEIAEYKESARKHGVEAGCFFVEKQPFEKLVAYQTAMDVLVIPYPDKPHFRDYGFPMKVWEYMASGRPVVYSNLAIIREILGGRGEAFEPGSAASLAASIQAVWQNKERAGQRAAQNSLAVKAYTWEARAKNMVAFMQK
ncbi:MAG: glycosyltransferase family 4 protein [Patescibacteria group bacterium]